MTNISGTEATEDRERALREAAQEFGRRVKRLRKDAGLTQQELADRLGQWGRSYHQTTVAKLESGTRPTTLEELIPLSVALGVSQREFFQDPSPNERAERKVREAEQELLELRSQVSATRDRYRQLQDELKKALEVYSLRLAALRELDPSATAERNKVVDDLSSEVPGVRVTEDELAAELQQEAEDYQDLANETRVNQWPLR
ncbi:helix-turn-helix domain-containing protein [Nesterenkonia halotolerans]|uniref:helix-turn-helix domain-containing protein n=1 Tax=Nesterenkonia halotolerans TaxID=225325 RepID=UPI003EE724AA